MQTFRAAVFGVLVAGLAGCGGSGPSTTSSVPAASSVADSSSMPAAGASPATSAAGPAAPTTTNSSSGDPSAATPQVPGPVPLILSSAASSRDWATVGVRVLQISLTQQSGGAPVTVYTAPASTPAINLEQLDHVSQLLAEAVVPPGTYTGAVITMGANPGDVVLTSSDDPDSNFAAPLSASVPSQNIQIQNSQGRAGAMTVTIPVTLPAPYVVSSTAHAQAPLNLDISMAHPALVQSHTPVTNDPTLWAVDFQGPVTAQAISDVTSLVLRQLYGTLGGVAGDGKSITITLDSPTQPAVTPETAVSTSEQVTILADPDNGTQFYDVDAGTSLTFSNFAALPTLTPGRFLRISARYQADGSLVASRIWTGNTFQSIWSGPEGHVMQVDATNGTLTIEDASGNPVQVQTDANTEFDYHGSPIGTGSGFLAAGHIVRGFKVHVSPRSTGSGEMLAQSIDIESALYWGAISNTTPTGFTYTSQFARSSDNYTFTLGYISPSTPNGTAADGTPIKGYAYWDFAFPTEIAYGTSAATDFQLATSGTLTAYGTSLATWDDPAAPSAWALRSTMLLPEPLGLATVSTGLVNSGFTSTFSLTPVGTSAPLAIQLITASGSAPLIYQLNRSHGSVTMNPLDITTSSGLAQLSAALTPGVYVNVFGLPKSSGTVQAYTLLYYTGINPRRVAPPSGNTCNGSFTGHFAGTITVIAGQDCAFSTGSSVEGNIKVNGGHLELSAATVKGNVQVQGGGTVSILDGTTINGNLQIQNLPAVSEQNQICGATITGNLQYQNNRAAVQIGAAPDCPGSTVRGNLQAIGNSAEVAIADNMVTGNLQDQSNSASTQLDGNTIGGNLQLQNNTGASTEVSGNVVGKNLQCDNNASISGGGNSAKKKQGQCASL